MRKLSQLIARQEAVARPSSPRAVASASINLSPFRFAPRSFQTGTLVLSMLLVAASLSCLSGCKKAAPAAAPPPVVEVMEIKTTNAPSSVEFIGQLDSPQNVEIRARVEGFVDKMLFTEGTKVTEGQPLFKLDDKPYQERLAAAKG